MLEGTECAIARANSRLKLGGSATTRLRCWGRLVRMLRLQESLELEERWTTRESRILAKAGWTRLSYRWVIMWHEVLDVPKT